MARRTIAVLAGVALGGAGLVGFVSPPPAAAIGPSPTIRQFAGAVPTPYRVPDSVTKAGAGLYVTDEHAIERVDLESDAFAIWAGDRSTPGSADGALATARFDNPSGIATDEHNLYLADTGNHTIRKIDVGRRQVSTLAGTPGASGSTDAVGAVARFNRPAAVAVSDDRTRLFVADEGNGTVRAIDLATRQVTTLAGAAGQFGTADGTGAAARFTAPRAIHADGGVLWIGDGARIRKLVTGTAQVTTLTEIIDAASNTVTGISSTDTHLYVADLYDDGDGGVTTNLLEVDKVTGGYTYHPTSFSENSTGVVVEGQTLFVVGSWLKSQAIGFEVDLVTGTHKVIGGFGERFLTVDGVGPAARLEVPEVMGSDGTNLYVLGGSAGIRKVAPNGAVTTLPGQVFGGDVATDGVNLYTVDSRDVKKVVLATGQVTTLVTIGSAPDFAQGIALDGDNLYISHTNCALYRYQLSTGTLSVHAGVPGACTHMDGSAATARFAFGGLMGIHGDDLFVAESPSGIRRVKVSTGAVSTVTSAGLSYPGDVSSDGTYVYTTSRRPPLPYVPTDIVKVSIATGAVTVLTGQHPLTYSARAASTTTAGDSVPTGGYVRGVTALHGGHDIYFLNQTGVGLLTDAKVPPHLTIGDVTITEGNGGTGLAVFTARLSSPQPNLVSVVFLTNDGTATSASGDYVAQSGRLDFPPGVVEQRVKITVNGDTTDEADESFKVRLAWPSGGAVLGRAIGTATVLDDDPNRGGATLALGDVSIVEGDDLSALAIFPVRLSSAQPGPVSVNFGTGNGTATLASGDYDARLGTLTIPTGVTNATIFVKVNGDHDPEALESFTLTIAGSSGPAITRAIGTGRIINDD